MPFHVTIDHAETANNSSRSGSSVTDEESSSGTGNTGVQVASPASAVGSHERDEYSEVEEDSWNHVELYTDDIGPSDSASRPRTSNQHRPIVEAPEPERPQPRRRQSSRRQILHERIPHRPHPRPRAPPQPPTAPGSVESYEEWAPQAPGAYVRTRPPHDGHVYWAAVPGNPQHNYTQSYSSAQAYSPYQTSGPAVAVGQQLVPFGNPGYGHTPYQGAPGGATHGYFPPGAHGAPPMGSPMMPPPGASPYTGQELMHRAPNAGYFQYPHNFAMPQPIPQPIPQPMVQPAIYPTYVYSPQPTPAPAPTPTPAPAAAPPASTPAPQPTPPPAAESPKVDEHFARFEKILMDERADREAREAAAKQAAEDAAAKAAAEKKIADDIAAASNAAAAAATEEAEKKAQEALAKAKEEADAAAAKAKEEADAAAKAAVEAATPAPAPPPPPEEKKKPIKFKDAGMEDLIRQAFLHVEVIGPHVAEGHYDLVGPQGDIILPQVWETVVEPDWTITMHMWPMPEPAPPEPPPADPVVDVPPAPPAAPDAKPSKKSINRKKGGGFSTWWAAGAPKPKPKSTKGAKKPS